MKNEFIRVRCTRAERIEIEERAEGDISKYVRRLLFDEQSQALSNIDRRLDELTELVQSQASTVTRKGEEIREPGQATGADPVTQGMLLELLMLLRMTASQPNKQAAQAEVERQGLPVFEFQKASKR
jgi:hypothetical protein